jgi:hypothetical protein
LHTHPDSRASVSNSSNNTVFHTPAESRVNEAPLRLAASQTLEQHAERLEIAIATGELQRLDARTGRVGIQALVHLYLQM